MLVVSTSQLAALQRTLAFYQGLARPGGAAFEPALIAGWEMAGSNVGLRGRAENPRNSLLQHSRLFLATSPAGENCLGFFTRADKNSDRGDLFLSTICRSLPATFRLELPAVFRSFPHCTDPLSDDTLIFLTAHALDEAGRLQTRTFARVKDLWRESNIRIDETRADALAARPAELAAMGALLVTRTFDCSDIRYASSPWARFIMRSDDGLEGILAARRLGMNWISAAEDTSILQPPGSVMSHGPL